MHFAEIDKYEKEFVGVKTEEEDAEATNRLMALLGMHASVYASSGTHGFIIPEE
ncbi:MAG: hypothetical protein Q4F15_00735 [Bacillota bacterium]|nr:hypothetical protein [Bacillota bacterium]